MKIALFLQDLAGGGAERVAVLLMNALAATDEVILILARTEGPYLADLDLRIRRVSLGELRTFGAIVPLARWLRRERPDVLVSHLTHVNIAAILAARLAMAGTPVIAVEHNQMDLNYARLTSRAVRAAYRAVRYVYPLATRIVPVSDGVGRSVAKFAHIGTGNFQTIDNPVVTPRLRALAAEAPEHPWFSDGGPPVVLGCGRLVEQKDFPNLIRAFAIVQATRPARLLILGEGPLRPDLEALIAELGLGADVALPGFDRNPFAAMRAAGAFVLSSRWEGLPTVLIEALASGAVVVSTDCPSGPREVLQDGRLGPLVPCDDAAQLATAIGEALDRPVDAAARRARGEDYTVERAAEAYKRLFEVVRKRPR